MISECLTIDFGIKIRTFGCIFSSQSSSLLNALLWGPAEDNLNFDYGSPNSLLKKMVGGFKISFFYPSGNLPRINKNNFFIINRTVIINLKATLAFMK